MTTAQEVYIYDVVRTARGKGREGGGLSTVKPVELLSQLYSALNARGFNLADVEDLILGCVTQTRDQGTNLAKVSALYAGLDSRIPGVTLNRLCTSGLDSILMAAGQLTSGMGGHLMLAGGIESMSRVPIFSDKGAWFADPEVAQKTRFVQMGFAADVVATQRGFTRRELDEWAASSHHKAARAQKEGYFARSIVPIQVEGVDTTFDQEELIREGSSADAFESMKPLFMDERSHAWAIERFDALDDVKAMHHRGNSPALADGAAMAILGTHRGDELTPRGKVLSWATASVDPVEMLTGSIPATKKALERANLSVSDIDLIEVNEAFAAPTLAFIRELGVDADRVNVNGGTIALGHAMGATGTMLVASVLDELERQNKRLGLVAVAGGAGVGSAMIVERA